ncbi:MAG: hypothetical protein RJA21_1603, partial [Gemmatimonadota bacterium]
MRILLGERVERFGRRRRLDRIALAIDATQHGVHQLAGADAMSTLRELDGLTDSGVGRHATHAE